MPATRRTLVKAPQTREGLPSSHLGRALTVTGVLDTEGDLYVYGNVRGEIHADRLFVRMGGCVEGDVVARDVRIEGRVIGRVFAFTVTLDSSADITGRIFHHVATVEKGAKIDGRMPWRPLNYFESFEHLPETKT